MTTPRLGGIGKTQTAVEYAYRYCNEYQAVLWTQADSRELLLSEITILAAILNLPEKNEQDQRQVFEAVTTWLNKHTNWLLILDNVEDLTTLNMLFPWAQSGHILLTTRTQATGTRAHCIPLEAMEPDEGGIFLLRRAKRLATDSSLNQDYPEDYMHARQLCQMLGGLPLALDQASAYIDETGCSLSHYITCYHTHRSSLLCRRGNTTGDHPESVMTTFSLTIKQVEEHNADALQLLQLGAFLHPEAIPEELIKEILLKPTTIEPDTTNLFKLDEAIVVLRRYSLVNRDADSRTISLHRMVQTVLKECLPENMQQQWAERAIRIVANHFPDANEVEMWPRCQRYLPHVHVCVAHIEQWNIQFPEAARLLHLAGYYLRERAIYNEAEELFRRALIIREQTLGYTHLDTAESLNDLGELYYFQSKYAQSECYFQKALTVRQQILEKCHPAIIESLNNLAVLYNVQGYYALAEPLLQQVVMLRENLPESDPLDTVKNLGNLAGLYYYRGKYTDAEATFQRTLDLARQTWGAEHPQVAFSLYSLGLVYIKEGKYALAETHLQQALNIFEQTHGSEHPRVSHCLNALAELACAQGQIMLAEPLAQRALCIREKTLGREHPRVADTLTILGRLSLAQGRYIQAEELLNQGLHVKEQMLGAEHPEVAQILNELALLCRHRSQYRKAEVFLQRAVSIQQKRLGQEHPDLIQSLNNLDELSTIRSQYPEADLHG